MTGKEKCELLKEIRKEIARINNIIYLSAKCDSKHCCNGTCPICDAEIKYLENELNEKATRGERITLSNISVDTLSNLINNYSNNNALKIQNEFNENIDNIEKNNNDEVIHKEAATLICDLDLTVRTYNILKKFGVQTLEDALNMDERKIGKRATQELKKYIFLSNLESKSYD